MTFRFDRFELDDERYQLRENGAPCAVEPKVFDLIALLVSRPQRVFSRDELIERVWAGRVVSDATVSTCVKNARKALGDSGGNQRFIKTVRGRGVCFAALVEVDEPPNAAATGSKSLTADADDDPSLLVLPFRALDGAAEALVLGDGLCMGLRTVLTRVPLLRLATGPAGDGVAPSARELHEKLGIDYLLEGSTQQAGAAFRIHAQLSDARSGFSLWAERFVVEGPVDDALERAVIAVVAKLEPKLQRALYDKVSAPRAGPTARALYLKASGILALKGWQHRTFAESAELLRECRRLDPGFALAPAYLSLVMGLGQRVGLMVNRDQAVSEALEAADQALELDAMNSTVLGFTGCALCDIGHVERGEALLMNAVEIEPANAQAWAALGSACLLQGRTEDAIKHLTHGISISPLDSRLSVWGALLALAQMMSGDLAAARQQAQTACQRDDHSYLPRVVLAAVQLLCGHEGPAWRALEDARRIKPDLSALQICSLVGRELGARLLELQGGPAAVC